MRRYIAESLVMIGASFIPFVAQAEILKGKVIDAQRKTPLMGSTIVAVTPDEGTYIAGCVADMDGNFQLSLPKEQSVLLKINYIGYQEQRLTWSLATHPHPFQIALEEASQALEEVIVTGKSDDRLLKEQGFAVQAIDTKKAMVSVLETDELLNRTAGIKIRQSGGVGSDMEYNINGLTGNSVRVYIDGVPIRNYGQNFSVSSLPASMIERVDVYKGVVPTHLADDALGGAINIILKKSVLNSLHTSYAYGSYNTHKWDMNGQYRHDKTGFTVGGNAFFNASDNDYEVWGDAVKVTNMETGRVEYIRAKRFHDDFQSQGASLNLGFTQVNWADKFLLHVMYSGMDKDVQHGPTMDIVYGNRRSEQDAYIANINYEKRDLLPRLDLKTQVSYSYTNRRLIDTCAVMYGWDGKPMLDVDGNTVLWNKGGGEGGEATLERNLERNWTARMNLIYAFDDARRHKLLLNAMTTHFTRDVEDPLDTSLEQSLVDTRRLSKITASASYDAKWLQDRLSTSLFYKFFTQRLGLTDPIITSDGTVVGQKIDHTTYDGGYGLATSYAITPEWVLAFSAERALRLPSINELLGNTAANVMPTYDLKPEQSINLNLGVLMGPFDFGRHRISANTNVFYRDVKDMIQRALTAPTQELYGYENMGKILSKGVDAEISYSYDDRLMVKAASSYTDARFNLEYDENGGKYAHYGARLRNMPYFTTHAEASYTWRNFIQRNSRLVISYYLNYTHEFYKNWETFGSEGKDLIPSQLTHDVSLSYTFPNQRISLALDAKNILNEQVFDNYALQKPGRMIFGKFSYKIY